MLYGAAVVLALLVGGGKALTVAVVVGAMLLAAFSVATRPRVPEDYDRSAAREARRERRAGRQGSVIQHVALEVRAGDAEAEVAFWALLGFTEVPAPATLAGRARWVQRGATQVHVLLAEAPVVPPHGHVAVIAEAFAETCARLAAAGRVPELRAEHWGAPRAVVVSPAGHRVELMAAPPA